MHLQELPDSTVKRIKKLIDLRDTTRKLIELQTYDAPDEEIKSVQSNLNFIYDNFVVEYGRICSRANKKAFEDDSSYYLLTSLEINDDKGIYYGQNVISKNMIIADRKKLLNGNSFILGVSGSGKSFTAKQEMTSVILKEPNADVLILDPERRVRTIS